MFEFISSVCHLFCRTVDAVDRTFHRLLVLIGIIEGWRLSSELLGVAARLIEFVLRK
jgi:hypothetical protein